MVSPDPFKGEVDESEIGFLDEESGLTSCSSTSCDVYSGLGGQIGMIVLGILLTFLYRPMAKLVLVGIAAEEGKAD